MGCSEVAAALLDESPEIRSTAVVALRMLDKEQAIASLLEVLDSAGPADRLRALATLEDAWDGGLVARLIGMLADPDVVVRTDTIQALARRPGERACTAAIDVLSHHDEQVAAVAASALGHGKRERGGPPLVAALKDGRLAVRRNAAWALGEMRFTDAIDPLIEALQEEDEALRDRAAVALLRMKGSLRAVPHFAAQLGRADPDSRRHAVVALDVLRKQGCKQPLIPLLIDTLTDRDADVRLAAVEALTISSWITAEPRLQQLADEDPDERVRLAAARALREKAPSAASEVGCEEAAAAKHRPLRSFEALVVHFQTAAIEELREALASGEANRRLAAAQGLGEQIRKALGNGSDSPSTGGSQATLALWGEVLAGHDPEARLQAIRPLTWQDFAFRQTPFRQAVRDILRDRLNNDEPETHAATAAALAALHDMQVIPHLICLLDEHHLPAVCIRAATALARFGSEPRLREDQRGEMLRVLSAALQHPHPDVRVEAARSLRAHSDARALAVLIAALASHPDAAVRHVAAGACGQWRTSESGAALLRALQDNEPSVRTEAAAALAGWDNVWQRALALPDETQRRSTVAALLWPTPGETVLV
jgi:HEAT repeat protein